MSTSASRSDRTSAARSPPSSITSVIARSRKVRRSATNAATSSGSSASGSRCGCRTSRPPLRGRPGPTCPSRPRRAGRRPVDRRAAGTGFSARTPVITTNSNSPRTAAIRRFIVAGAAPRPAPSRTTA
ncbi:MAG TPA: hypothetical protein VGS06_28190 [Streptosporangiaceae bacterium]|nr:hypothetical protein [Streptosporangiaceae bacterium]